MDTLNVVPIAAPKAKPKITTCEAVIGGQECTEKAEYAISFRPGQAYGICAHHYAMMGEAVAAPELPQAGDNPRLLLAKQVNRWTVAAGKWRALGEVERAAECKRTAWAFRQALEALDKK